MYNLPARLGSRRKPPVGGGSFTNGFSALSSGSATATAGHINFGQPSGWYNNLTSNEWTIAFWMRRNGRDGILFSNRIDSSAGFHLGLSGGALSAFAGGNFLSGGSGLGDGNWHFIVFTIRNESGTYVARIFVDGNTTSVANANAGSAVNSTTDFLFGHRRGSSNTDFSFGAYWNGYVDEFTVWNAGMTGTQAAELYNSGVPDDPNNHSQAANLTNWYRMGDDDSSPTILDNKGSSNATLINTATISFSTTVP